MGGGPGALEPAGVDVTASSAFRLVEPDLLSESVWECTSCEPSETDPAPPDDGFQRWLPAEVPGTAAGAMRAAGDPGALTRDYDAEDWWFRCRFVAPGPSRAHILRSDGLATIADVWLNGTLVLHSENMFVAHEVPIDGLRAENELLIRFASPGRFLAPRRPRPRWKCRDLVHQNLRWLRTSLTGRLTGGVAAPAPVGPWRGMTLSPRPARQVVRRSLRATVDVASSQGDVDVEVELYGYDADVTVTARVGDVEAELATSTDAGPMVARGTVSMGRVELWWPHTHGAQPLYDVSVAIGDDCHPIGRVGFRSVGVDRTDGAFTVRCNEEDLFVRGVCWTPPDPVSLRVAPSRLRRQLTTIRDGHLNMVRITGIGVYESDAFFDLCDELGLLVWQDCMFAFYDTPDSPEFRATVGDELTQVFRSLQGRPSVAVVCGGSENEQQAEYLGLAPEQWPAPIAETLIPQLVDELLPSTPYVRNSPGESPLPSMVDRGPGHYFGVGAYLAPLEDARRASVRFASECLAVANPPEPLDTPAGSAAASGLGHRPEWKEVIHRDSNTTWDLEDVRDWYTKWLFGIDMTELRRLDAERASLVARATVAAMFESVLSEWRRPGSTCAGAIVLQAHDAGFGGGIGMVDSLDRPKSSWYVMRRVMAPRVVLFSDEGVNGLGLHVVSDSPEPWTGSLQLSLYLQGTTVGDSVTTEVKVVDGHASVETGTIFGGFRDLNYAHKFSPPAYDVVAASLFETDGSLLSRAFFLPGQRLRVVEPDLGLRARLTEATDGTYVVEVSTERFAQWVSFDVVGWVPEDSWFHLAPDAPVAIRLHPTDGVEAPPRGSVTALNSGRPARLERAT